MLCYTCSNQFLISLPYYLHANKVQIKCSPIPSTLYTVQIILHFVIHLFRIISILSKVGFFRLPDHMILMEC
jgi:hypothetical protein